MAFDVFTVASLLGSVAFALSGFLTGVRKNLDIMGIFILSILTANGGGVVRDVLVGRVPAVLQDGSAFLLVLSVMIIAIVLKLHRKEGLENHTLFVLSDAVGLAAFSVTGALIGVEVGLGVFGVMVLAFATATGGGIIRDTIINEVPALFSSDFYGMVALIIGGGIFLLHSFQLDNEMTITGVFVFALLLRLLAYAKKWQLPRIKL